MNYFEKINLDLSAVDMNLIRGGSVQEGYSDTFRSYNLLDSEYFNELCSTRIKFKIPPDSISYTEITKYGALPHSEPAKCVLNYYVNTANAVTMFWVPKEPDYHGERIERIDENGNLKKSNVFSYDEKKLKVAGYFFAKPHSAYLIRTNAIHSVNKPKLDNKREIFRWLWLDRSIDEVLESIILIDD